MPVRLALLLALAAPPAVAQTVGVSGLVGPLPHARAVGPFQVTLSSPAAAPVTLTLSTGPEGELAGTDDPTSPGWASTREVTVVAGAQSAGPIFLRARTLAPVTLRITGGAAPLTRTLPVSPVVFSATMESLGTGDWDSSLRTANDSGVQVNGLAAHRGRGGLRIIDGDETPNVFTTVTNRFAPLEPAMYARGWLRIAPTNPSGLGRYFSVGTITGGLVAWVGSKRSRPGGLSIDDAQLGGDSEGAANRNLIDETRPGYADGGWHLIELTMEGVGTDAGRRVLMVDGVPVVQRGDLDWRLTSGDGGDWRPRRLQVGSGWAEPAGVGLTGLWDFDDVRVSVLPQASALEVRDGGVWVRGTCNPVRLGLRDSVDGGRATAFEPMRLWARSDAGSFGCLDGGALAEGEGEAVLGFTPVGTTARITVGVEGGDLLEVSHTQPVASFEAVVTPGEGRVAPGAAVALSGEGSRHPEGRPISVWRWRAVRAPTHVELPQTPEVRFAATEPGVYELALEVGDAAERSAPAIATITVEGETGAPTDRLGGCYCAQLDAASLVGLVLACNLWVRRRSHRL